jgi:23S rRNA (uracil1939-C5)-methyltransferase
MRSGRDPARRMSRRATVEVESIAAGGDGIARVEGLVVFLPRTAPGDVGEAEFALKGRLARGRLVSLERPSPERTEPPCPHYVQDRCGGCQLQHLAYPAQLAAKGRVIADALSRIGGRPSEPPAVRPSTRPWRYRRKLTLALRRVGERWIAGLHPYDAPGRVFDLRDCPITDERVLAIWAEVRAAGQWLPRVPALRVAVRLLEEGEAAVVVEGGGSWPQAARFFAAAPSVAALWWEPTGGRRRLLHDRRGTALPGASFVQVNPEVAAALEEHVLARVLAHSPATVVDGYAGAGDTAAALAERGVRVTAVELDREASAWSAERLPPGSRAVAARVEDVLEGLLPADVVLLNPPRAGVDERVTSALVARPPRAIVYVSCNPATLARDLGRLPGFRPASIVAFDMFPQTAHVETVCELVPEAA